ncbi:MAG: hypothetical protein FWE36_08015 [Erysipelotrichales bacterium]|nr:hypothetical protein [Erysipelotrichales bacterium]
MISINKQLKIGCIPFIGFFAVSLILYFNITKMNKKEMILFCLIWMPLSIIAFFGIVSGIDSFATKDNYILNYSILLLSSYILTFTLISSQVIARKLFMRPEIKSTSKTEASEKFSPVLEKEDNN